ncbi:MAG: hypothetical protein A3F16_00605 [Deltaproteobacteria bacterium RIFCSPHIGHO2_12_FULL_43_9]|nr:MAG: hypothetical protein A3F16_00605 [Deltaproteobacteria bacterium RIFCSPHIGHO2_12_FULL_43_9]
MLEEQIKVLEVLEELDHKIDKIKSEQAIYPAEIKKLEKSLHEEQAKITEQQNVINELTVPKKEIENELAVDREHVSKMSQRLNEMKTNETYQAALKEIANFRKTIEEKEGKLLLLMEQIEEATKTLEARQKVIDEQQKLIEEKGKLASTRQKELGGELTTYQKNRDIELGKLDREIGRKYEFIRSRLHGSAVAKIEAGACQACHMRLPPQLLIQLQRGDKIHNCPSCKRIIILPTMSGHSQAVHQ